MAKQNQEGTSPIAFNKGMVKDNADLFHPDGSWSHARNAVNSSFQGDVGVLSNEPSNKFCTQAPYTIIGTIHISDDEWVIFSTDNNNSEIGYFKEATCTYTKIINAPCLAFDKNHLITGASRENFDCTRQIYWDDGKNPSRTLNINNPPYITTRTVVDDCVVNTPTDEVNCEALRLAPLFKVPCIGARRGDNPGTLYNGSYQAAIAYSINGQRVTDYIALSNVVSLFDHDNANGSLEIKIDGLETETFEEYELVIVSNTKTLQADAKIIGYYSTNQDVVFLDNIAISLVTVELSRIPILNAVYEKSDAMFPTGDYLIRTGVYERFNFNYQLQANNIKAHWVAVEYPADYYRDGSNRGYMRDEQYAFFIRWVYNTGERSFAYHIPGRAALATDTQTVGGNDVIYPTKNRRWQNYNTATQTSAQQSALPDGGRIVARGDMAYWQSTERYPDNKPERWGDLCGKPIRHHKFPDDGLIPRHNAGGTTITVLGVEFSGITIPVDNEGNPITSVVGYEILRASRLGNKSIIAKGLINNMGSYQLPGEKGDDEDTIYFQNYPFNDLRKDPYLSTNFVRGATVINNAWVRPFDTYKDNKKYFTFHSPELGFNRTFLSATELRIYGEAYGKAKGTFIEPKDHPEHVILRNFAALVSFFLGLGKLDTYLRGERTILTVAPLGPNLVPPYIPPVVPKSAGTTAQWFNTILSSFGVDASIAVTQTIKSSDFNSLPEFFRPIAAIPAIIRGISEGVDEYVNKIYDFLPYRQHALQHVAHGYYNQFKKAQIGNMRRLIDESTYVTSAVHQFENNTKVNNLFRSRTVALKVTTDVNHPTVVDESRYTVGQNKAWRDPFQSFVKPISSHYAAMKFDYENQYGQIDSNILLPAGCNISIPADTQVNQKFKSPVIFGGDTYINRYTEKNTMFFFNNWMMDQPDGTVFDYRKYFNLPYATYWMDSARWTAGDFGQGIGTGLRNTIEDIFSPNGAGGINREQIPGINTLPSNLHNLDMDRVSPALFTFGVRYGYMYLFNSGVRDFFVESEFNTAHRDHEDRPETRHYDFKEYTSLEDLFDIHNITRGNYYKYDLTLSVSNFPTYKYTYAILQPRYYNPITAEDCELYYPTRAVYSLPNTSSTAIKDPWKVFLTNNIYDFGSRVANIKINVDGTFLILQENDPPLRFLAQDTLQLDLGTKISVGDAEVFERAPQALLAADGGYEYGTCQNTFGSTSTPYGVFWMSSKQGKIFQYSNGLQEISRSGMKWWLSRYMPFRILEDFPDFPLTDNAVNGVGTSVIFDSTEELVYFSKKDYMLRPEFKGQLVHVRDNQFALVNNPLVTISLQNTDYFAEASWTLSYDLKTKSWISFHDWHPNLVIPSQSHFFSIKDNKLWLHNDTCQSFSNFYGTDYPFEVEILSNTGVTVTTLRSMEYQVEAYQYKDNCSDAHHVLDFNFDRAVVHNSEQVSGLLKLNLNPKNNSAAILTYPRVNVADIDILYSKEENKYRFNQFWDITRDRGEFSATRRHIWNTEPNGYIRTLNPVNLDYNKDPHQRKKFRHYHNHILLRRNVSGNNHILLNLASVKVQYSPR